MSWLTVFCIPDRKMLEEFFRSHGQFCADHQWEVIVSVLTLTICMLSMGNSWSFETSYAYSSYRTEETNPIDVILMTIIRCIAVLYTYYQFRKLRKLDSNYILGIAGLFILFSSFVFSSTVVNILRTDVADLKDALFFFVLVIDLSKASELARFALSSSNQKEANSNIARGMAWLGPTITLDTFVGVLVISVGTLSGVKRLETLCWFACMSYVVNYFVFMTFYPACLSLVLELSRNGSSEKEETGAESKSPLVELFYDEGHKPNPVAQRIKVIMSAGMMIVHAHSHWSLNHMENDTNKIFSVLPGSTLGSMAEAADRQSYLTRFPSMSLENIVICIITIAFVVKGIFFDDRERFAHMQLLGRRQSSDLSLDRRCQQVHKQCQTEKEEPYVLSTSCQTESGDSEGADRKPGTVTIRESMYTQTEAEYPEYDEEEKNYIDNVAYRPIKECMVIYKEKGSAADLNDREIINLVQEKVISMHELETKVEEPVRGVGIRRMCIAEKGNFKKALKTLPYHNYDYTKVMGACCENVMGYIPVPLGICGPLTLNGKDFYVPMATTEGCLVASTNRGCRAIREAHGAISEVYYDGMTRAPVVRFPSVKRACEAMKWMTDEYNYELVKAEFDQTSRFAKLQKIQVNIQRNLLFIRFTATTGDAMGMNMVSKGAENALKFIKEVYRDMEILGLSGNFCTDKKASAVNWLEGRGKGVICEAVIPGEVVRKVLKTSAKAMVDLNISKNFVGSSAAVTIGGYNAQAANIVTAIYIATGQDPAQNVCSSNCTTWMETCGKENEDLHIYCQMPCVEVGTIGGGTSLPAQSSCLDMLGVRGSNEGSPGDNAKTLAQIVCGTVMAGELSLMAALCEGDLVKSHLLLNRTSVSDSRKSSVISNLGSTTTGICTL